MFISSITSTSFRDNRIVKQSDWGKWSIIVEKALNSQNMAIFSNDYEHFQHGPEFICQVKNIMKVANIFLTDFEISSYHQFGPQHCQCLEPQLL